MKWRAGEMIRVQCYIFTPYNPLQANNRTSQCTEIVGSRQAESVIKRDHVFNGF